MPVANAIIDTYRPYGGNREVFRCTDAEVLLSGPAGTGKSRANLEYLNYLAMTYPGARLLMVRKTRRSLSESGMVTFEQKVLHPAQRVHFHASKQQYQYPNGSVLAVGGLDKPSKIMSSDWDVIFAQEATELDENDWESCSIRLRYGKTPVQQLLGDCNPDKQIHWLLQRARNGLTRMFETRHEDNPVLFNRDGSMTPEGARYLAKLDRLTGVRYQRYRLGLWVSAEGMVLEDSWDRARNLVDTFEGVTKHTIPLEWPRYLVVDFGYVHPFVCLWIAVDPDGRMYVYRQIYRTKRLVEDHAKDIRRVSRWGEKGGDPLPREIITDHDAEDRHTLERHLGLYSTPAYKSVSDGLQALAARLRPAGDGKPRLVIFRDCLVERDTDLMDGKQPTCVEDEPESYVWDTRQGMKKGEQPVKDYDHGIDCLRYACARLDLKPGTVSYFPSLYGG